MATPKSTLRAASADEPVKIVLERRVRPDGRVRFEAWVRKLMDLTSRTGGLQGSSVLTSGTTADYFILLRFANRAHLKAWQESTEVLTLLEEGDVHSVAADQSVVKTGLETWFTLPDMPAPRTAPPRWKMAIVTWVALLPQIIVLSYLIPPLHLSFLAATALSTALPVVMLTWVLMPWLTRLLYGWLYAGTDTMTQKTSDLGTM
jgi:antibiotic biosynthesis monooxygenase (ABM) superfamily enzyme